MKLDRFDRLTRNMSTRRGLIGRVVAGSLTSLLGVSAVQESEAAQKSCAGGKKRCGRLCISRSKPCCTGAKKACGKKCIPKAWPCCPASKKRCRKACIPKTACCTHADCDDLYLCAKHTCVIGRGTCQEGADICNHAPSTASCNTANDNCNCYRTTTGATRCGDVNFLDDVPCITDAGCARQHPTIPGVFCAQDVSPGGGPGTLCPGATFCMAPCTG